MTWILGQTQSGKEGKARRREVALQSRSKVANVESSRVAPQRDSSTSQQAHGEVSTTCDRAQKASNQGSVQIRSVGGSELLPRQTLESGTKILQRTPLEPAAETDTARQGTSTSHMRPSEVNSESSDRDEKYMTLGKQLSKFYKLKSDIVDAKKQAATQSAEYEKTIKVIKALQDQLSEQEGDAAYQKSMLEALDRKHENLRVEITQMKDQLQLD
ncbi:hypothetical protein LTR09_012075 [Extremus antarcticus]|uniref:Uncharacterized protein n=1 Tax=Extremus antarcticus TaxID=702011 RepID=A0AAJ0DAL5_9PEZI|nr:hypothetical protein LTR09_012075 [Extremus antarcticus]